MFKAQAFNHYIRLQFDIYLYTKKALSLEMENKIVSKLGLFLFEVSGKIFIMLKLAIINSKNVFDPLATMALEGLFNC